MKQHREALAAASANVKGFNVDNEKFFKVKWTRVPDLVEKRKVFLQGGMAYVPRKEQSSIIFQEFQKSLEKALEVNMPYSLDSPQLQLIRYSLRRKHCPGLTKIRELSPF